MILHRCLRGKVIAVLPRTVFFAVHGQGCFYFPRVLVQGTPKLGDHHLTVALSFLPTIGVVAPDEQNLSQP